MTAALVSRIVFLTAAASALVLDRVTKALITDRMTMHHSVEVVGEWVRLTYIHNSGAAFGLFPGSRWFLIAVSLVAVVVIGWLGLARIPRRPLAFPLGLVLGGAIGNLVDRIRLGEVVDFINVGVGPHRWPVFNVADSAVTVGVVWLAVVVVLLDRRPTPSTGLNEDTVDGLASPDRTG